MHAYPTSKFHIGDGFYNQTGFVHDNPYHTYSTVKHKGDQIPKRLHVIECWILHIFEHICLLTYILKLILVLYIYWHHSLTHAGPTSTLE